MYSFIKRFLSISVFIIRFLSPTIPESGFSWISAPMESEDTDSIFRSVALLEYSSLDILIRDSSGRILLGVGGSWQCWLAFWLNWLSYGQLMEYNHTWSGLKHSDAFFFRYFLVSSDFLFEYFELSECADRTVKFGSSGFISLTIASLLSSLFARGLLINE